MPVDGLVFDIKRFSIHDGPGIRTTVFFKGCPLNCWWCHNPEGQADQAELIFRPERCIGCGACLEVCERDAIATQAGVMVTDRERCAACGACVEVCYAEGRELAGRRMTVDQVMDEIGRDVAFYDESRGGVTVSGGEPLHQPAFARALLSACKERGLHTALDTCGYAPWNELDRLRQDVDLFLYDLKVMDRARHENLTGVPNELILENLERLSRRGHRIVLRVAIIPGINDDEENVRRLGVFASGLPYLLGVDLLPYHRIGQDKHGRLGRSCPLADIEPPSRARMDEIAQALRGTGAAVRVGG